MTIRVLVVDDHPMTRRGVVALISDEEGFTVCAEAGDAREAVQRFADSRPDVVIVDLSLPGESGLTLIERLSALDPQARILVLSVQDEFLYAERAMRNGALGFVSKSAPADELIRAIHRVAEGRSYLSDDLTERVLTRATGRAPRDADGLAVLSARELEVLDLIAQGLRPSEIGRQLSVSVKTVERHRENIKAKLGLRSAYELMRVALSRRDKG